MIKRLIVVLAITLLASLKLWSPPIPKPPEHIVILNTVFTIRLVRVMPVHLDPNNHFLGYTCDQTGIALGECFENHTVYILDYLALHSQQEILVHEIQHSIMGTVLSDAHTTYHDYIFHLSDPLLRVIQDNPELMKYLEKPSL